MVEQTIETTNGKGERCRTKVYGGEKISVSSIIGVCEVTIRKNGSSEALRIEDPKALGEIRRAIDKICRDKAIK